MKIHTTAKFSGIDLNFHDSFQTEVKPEQVEKLVNLAVAKLKKKCENYFNVEWQNLISIEVYFYDNQGNEKIIFKKVKE